MIPELRERFNANYTPEKYQHFLAELDRRSGSHVKFRNSETPCFFSRELVAKMAAYGRELIEQLVANPAYLSASERAIPAEYKVPNESPYPLFVQVDFGIDEDLQPKLVEIQGFPSLYAYQPALGETYRDVYGLDRDLHTTFVDAYEHTVRQAVLGGCNPENVVLMEIDPWD